MEPIHESGLLGKNMTLLEMLQPDQKSDSLVRINLIRKTHCPRSKYAPSSAREGEPRKETLFEQTGHQERQKKRPSHRRELCTQLKRSPPDALPTLTSTAAFRVSPHRNNRRKPAGRHLDIVARAGGGGGGERDAMAASLFKRGSSGRPWISGTNGLVPNGHLAKRRGVGERRESFPPGIAGW